MSECKSLRSKLGDLFGIVVQNVFGHLEFGSFIATSDVKDKT